MSEAAAALPELEAPAVELEQPETPPSTPDTPPPDTPAGDKPPVTPEVKVDGRQLPPKVREMMEALKTADPKAHTFLKDILFADRAFRQEFPGGLAEAKQLKANAAEFAK